MGELGEEGVSDDECMHLLDPATCTLCNGHDKRERGRKPVALGRSFPARFDGWCGGCGGDIETGESIVRTDDGYVHVHCAEAAS